MMQKLFNMLNVNIETFMQQAIENSIPQPHKLKWTEAEDKIIANCIENGLSLSDIHRIISLRTPEAIRSRGNHLGDSYYRNKDDGLTYFHNEINHKYRRTKDKTLEAKEFKPIPIESKNSLGKDIKVVVDIIPKKQIIVYIKDMFNISLQTNLFHYIHYYPHSTQYYSSINAVSKVVVSRDCKSDRQVTEEKNYIFIGEE